MSLGLFSGFCKAAERLVLAWRIACTFEVGGEGEVVLETEQ